MEQTVLEQTKREHLVSLANSKNVMLSPQALELLETAEIGEAENALSALVDQNVFFIKASDVENKLLRSKIIPQEIELIPKTGFRPLAKEYNASFRERTDLNSSEHDASEGTVAEFVKMFQNRFESLAALFRSRPGFSPRPISVLKNSSQRDVELVGMVSEKWTSKNGHITFRIEDTESECIALALKDRSPVFGQAKRIMLDEVVGIRGGKGQGNLIIIKELLQPDLPQQPLKTISEPLATCVISDIHVGSKLFLEGAFQKFLNWLNGKEGLDQEKQLAGQVKYLYICGDNVDGIGVYPEQHKNLLIQNIDRQYAILEELLLQVPEYVEIAMIPGQHDAVRWADPQPAIPKRFFSQISKFKNFHLLPSPGWTQMEGLNVVQYHGASLHELYGTVEGLSMEKPELAMVEILKRRSFLTNFGGKQPFAPEKKDFLVIRETPDLYLGGDMHHFGYANYRGCTALNGACFQSQTDFEQKMGHIPTPGVAAVINLQTRNVVGQNFWEENK